MNLKEYKAKKEKSKFKETDDMSLLIQKRNKKAPTSKNSEFRNNYKNYPGHLPYLNGGYRV